jgi:hypothetical protein
MATSLTVLLVLAWSGFSGQANGCFARNECHCERVNRDAAIAQPVNTWSNVAYWFAGLLILIAASKDGEGKSGAMRGVSPYTTTFGILVMAIGTGSMFFHASMTNWGGAIDVAAMNLFLSYQIFFTLKRVLNLRGVVFWSLWIAVNLVFITLRIVRPVAGLGVFEILFVSMLALEAMIAVLARLNKRAGLAHAYSRLLLFPLRNWKLLAIALACFGSGYAFWTLWQNASPFCDPDSLFQGHAVWHFLTAVSTWFLFAYLRSEKNLPHTAA